MTPLPGSPSTERRPVPSWQARLTRRLLVGFLRLRGELPEIDPDEDPERLARLARAVRDDFERLARFTPMPRSATVTPALADGVEGEWVVDERAENDRVVFHVHGGGYVLGSARTHRGLGRAMSRVARARTFLPEYRLAPEHRYPAALDDVVAAYRWLVHDQGVDPDRLAVSGDSAGGGLALAMLVVLRDAGERLPACYVGFSPWTDLAATGDSVKELDGTDPWLRSHLLLPIGQAYAGDTPADDPYISPLYADLEGLPPMLVHAGSDEILLDDGRRLVERARAAGVEASVGVFGGLWHVFQAFPGLPESRNAMREVGGFIRRHTGGGWVPH